MPTPYPKPEPRPKKLPQPLKRTPLKKKQVKIRHFTPERAALERQKTNTYRSLDRVPYCRGCGTTQNLNHSHRLPQGNRQHIANPKNLDFYCQTRCHDLYERGFMWLLDNGIEVMEFLRETDFEFYRRKCFKMRDRIEESRIREEDLPGWVVEILQEIKM